MAPSLRDPGVSGAGTWRQRTQATLVELGADPALLRQRRLPLHREARRLVCVGLGSDGRDKFLLPDAAAGWDGMATAAAADGVVLQLLSAFRSFDYQLALIRAKLARGQSFEQVLAVNAPPGCSEHHSARAVDVGSAGCPPLEEAFENTDAFAWLSAYARRFGFTLSYPRGNRYGYLYEPWHWCWHRTPA
ncbi:MAG: M15 family metallopeptidase [Gammaproteobacteria bacterium]|nr:M15 family metallopeptidase [Gammaproteobacteria bacterium]